MCRNNPHNQNYFGGDTQIKSKVTCIILGQHGSVDNSLKRSDPVFPVPFCLTRKQEVAVRGHNGDPELPVGALNVRGKAGEGGVAAVFTPDENLSPRIRILEHTHVIRINEV